MNKLDNWGAILWKRWEKAQQVDKIIGFWAEDNNEFEVTVPAQLRDMLLAIQNWLSDFYTKVEDLQAKIKNIQHFFD